MTMPNTENTADTRCPTEWEGKAHRIKATTPAGIFYGWELTEPIEGYTHAGQVWLDGEPESIQIAADWDIEIRVIQRRHLRALP